MLYFGSTETQNLRIVFVLPKLWTTRSTFGRVVIMGRPRKGIDKMVNAQFRATLGELNQMRKRAHDLGRNFSEWARTMLLEGCAGLEDVNRTEDFTMIGPVAEFVPDPVKYDHVPISEEDHAPVHEDDREPQVDPGGLLLPSSLPGLVVHRERRNVAGLLAPPVLADNRCERCRRVGKEYCEACKREVQSQLQQ